MAGARGEEERRCRLVRWPQYSRTGCHVNCGGTGGVVAHGLAEQVIGRAIVCSRWRRWSNQRGRRDVPDAGCRLTEKGERRRWARCPVARLPPILRVANDLTSPRGRRARGEVRPRAKRVSAFVRFVRGALALPRLYLHQSRPREGLPNAYSPLHAHQPQAHRTTPRLIRRGGLRSPWSAQRPARRFPPALIPRPVHQPSQPPAQRLAGTLPSPRGRGAGGEDHQLWCTLVYAQQLAPAPSAAKSGTYWNVPARHVSYPGACWHSLPCYAGTRRRKSGAIWHPLGCWAPKCGTCWHPLDCYACSAPRDAGADRHPPACQRRSQCSATGAVQ
jgi:hypothetical protein